MRKRTRHRWGEGRRLSENVPQICPVPSDGDPVVSVGVSKICTKTLVFIGYGANLTQDFFSEHIIHRRIWYICVSIF